MERDIKDYLHLYIGSDINMEVTWKSVITGALDSRIKSVTVFTLYMYDHEPGYDIIIKPILRPLSEMADDEARKVAMIALNRDDANGLKISRTPEKDYVSIWYAQWLPLSDYEKENWSECNLEICISGDFTIYNHTFYRKGNGTAVGNQPLYRQHEITKYLLSRGFDLFNLIPDGLAIDATTINKATS